jgi:hypothetical protein
MVNASIQSSTSPANFREGVWNEIIFFLPNLNRAIKARYVTKSVRIQGKKEGHGIWVDRLDVKKNAKYQNVWSWKEQQEMYKSGGG